ncbi:MAG: hypothetical protein ABIH79_01070 [archaeon]
MKGKFVLLVSLMLLVVSGCSTTNIGRLNKIQLGLTSERTIQILGKNFTQRGSWINSNGDKVVIGLYNGEDEIILHFCNGILKEFGSYELLSASRNWYKLNEKQINNNKWEKLYKDNPSSKKLEEKEQEE